MSRNPVHDMFQNGGGDGCNGVDIVDLFYVTEHVRGRVKILSIQETELDPRQSLSIFGSVQGVLWQPLVAKSGCHEVATILWYRSGGSAYRL
jgi:hypothetical protein